MFAVLFASSLAALLLVYICIPAVWCAIMADDALDAHEAGLMVVASRTLLQRSISPHRSKRRALGNPFRETGPPANMAKLILLRHKVGHLAQCKRNIALISSHFHRFKRATGNVEAPHIHARHHEITWLSPLNDQKPLGCASAGLLLGSNPIDAHNLFCEPLHYVPIQLFS